MAKDQHTRSLDLWFKAIGLFISFFALITIPLITTIGSQVIQGQEKTNVLLTQLIASDKTQDSRIMRNEADISKNSAKIYTLERR